MAGLATMTGRKGAKPQQGEECERTAATTKEADEAWAVARRESNPRFEPDPNRSISLVNRSC